MDPMDFQTYLLVNARYV